ncbi:hypothetical protein Tco_0875518 [Tanacetum coccineum]|uniref:Zinc finger, CCHC-type n=1 Tax=Tanacetum coccineum TaxID=301880 RepID=A0ABQ5BSJ6_9ASTR
MASNFAKLDKFERVDFRRWQKKMHFLLYSMSVVYVLTTPIPEDGENATCGTNIRTEGPKSLLSLINSLLLGKISSTPWMLITLEELVVNLLLRVGQSTAHLESNQGAGYNGTITRA